MLEMQEVKFAPPGRPASEKQSPQLQRVFNNRHIENAVPRFRFDQILPVAGRDPRSAGRALKGLCWTGETPLIADCKLYTSSHEPVAPCEPADKLPSPLSDACALLSPRALASLHCGTEKKSKFYERESHDLLTLCIWRTLTRT